MPPPGGIQIYLAVLPHAPVVWAAVAVVGGDGIYDETATVYFEAAAPANLHECDPVASAVIDVLRILATGPLSAAPVAIHTSSEVALKVAGVHHDQQVYRAIRST